MTSLADADGEVMMSLADADGVAEAGDTNNDFNVGAYRRLR